MDDGGVRETHVSILLFLGDRVLKLRKPLRFDFADFSTLSARAEDCRREVELNRRLAPDVYLGVAEVIMGDETLEPLCRDAPPAGGAVAGSTSSALQIGVRLGGRNCARWPGLWRNSTAGPMRSAEISKAGSIDAVTGQFEANVAATARFVGTVLDPTAHDASSVPSGAIWRVAAPLFSARIAAGQICDGHGDLQAGDIYCLDDGPRILDCLEFDDQLRYGDVAADVAFLAMDLETARNRPGGGAVRPRTTRRAPGNGSLPPSCTSTSPYGRTCGSRWHAFVTNRANNVRRRGGGPAR